MAYWRARILSGDAQVPLAEALAVAEADPSPTTVLDHALLLLAARQDDAAVTELETLAVQPDVAPVALRLLGLVEFQQGKLDEATRRFTELVAAGQFTGDAFYYLGLIAERLGDVPRAMRFYAEVQGGDNAVPALLRASNLLQAHGEAPAAQELLDHLIEDDPSQAPEVFAARAKIFSDTGQGQRAIEVLNQGAQEYPDNADIRYAVASTYEDQGRLKPALRELKDVLNSRPEDPAAMNAYGYTLADHNMELRRARMLIERAHAQAPRNAAILDSLGWVLYRQGHDEQALSYLQDAYAEDRGADIAAHLGEVLWRIGRQEEAKRSGPKRPRATRTASFSMRRASACGRPRSSAMRRLAAMLVCVAALGGCATSRHELKPAAAPSAWDQRMLELERAASWQLDGRAAAALGSQGWQASLNWVQRGSASDLHLAGPLGVGATDIKMTPSGVSLNGAPPSGAALAQLQDKLTRPALSD